MWILYIYVHILKTATKTIFQKFKGKKSFITLRFVCQMDYLTFYLPLLISTALGVPWNKIESFNTSQVSAFEVISDILRKVQVDYKYRYDVRCLVFDILNISRPKILHTMILMSCYIFTNMGKYLCFIVFIYILHRWE